MKPVKVYRNQDVEAVYAYIPPGHRHIRLVVETRDQKIVFQEATVAGMVRAYLDVLLHPTRRAVALKKKHVQGKPGYAEHQLVEDKWDEDALRELVEAGLA